MTTAEDILPEMKTAGERIQQSAAVAVPDSEPAAQETVELHEPAVPDTEESIAAAITSPPVVSFGSSLAFHLIIWAAVLLLGRMLGLEWDLFTDDRRPVIASLGDEEILDRLPEVELAGDIDLKLEQPSSTLQDLARQLQRDENAALLMTLEDTWKNLPGTDSPDSNATGSGVLLRVPESGLAVTKGSFTAFTIPAQPQPMQAYHIVIEVRLPNNISKFRVSDLSGEVRGTDKYTQKIPYDSRAPYAAGYPAPDKSLKILDGSTELDVIQNRVQIVIRIPGGDRLVKDVIKIRSRKLKEEQELTLVFGGSPGRENNNPYEDANRK